MPVSSVPQLSAEQMLGPYPDPNYITKLNLWQIRFNELITQANNAVQSGADAAVLKAEVEQLKADINASNNQVLIDIAAMADQVAAVAAGSIAGTTVDFSGVKVNGQHVYHPGNKPSLLALGLDKVNNTLDAEKPVSVPQREAIDLAVLDALGAR